MTVRQVQVLALVLVAALATAARADTVNPLAAVGILAGQSFGGCSAALIGPDVVLTAAHCVEEVAKTPGKLTFRTGAYPGTPQQVSPAQALAFHPLYFLRLDSQLARLRFDLALVRLARPIDPELVPPLDLGAAPEIGERLLLASYRGGRGIRARERRCEVFPGPRELFGLGCEVAGGESGAPVLRAGPDGIEIVAVLSSRSRVGQQPVGFSAAVMPRIAPIFDALDPAPQPASADP